MSYEDRIKTAVANIESRDARHARRIGELRTRLRKGGDLGGLEGRLESTVGVVGRDAAMETIVLRSGRPVLAVKDNEPEVQLDDEDAAIWRDEINGAHDRIVQAIRAVGRIELLGYPGLDWVGTGWLVAADTVVTNRHVAEVFSRSDGQRFVFRMGLGGQPMSASVDFLEEVESNQGLEFNLVEVLYIEPADGPDMALFRVADPQGRGLAQPISLATAIPDANRSVAVIGYPARDSRIPEQDLMDQIFGNVYNKKRLAPGKITGVNNGLVEHDSSTLGGNSGSVVLDLATGQAVALHFSGRFLVSNYAVPATAIASRLQSGRGRGGASSNGGSRNDGLDRSDAVGSHTTTTTAGQRVTCTFPVIVTVEVGAPNASQARGNGTPAVRMPGVEADLAVTEAKAAGYADREGYAPDFLGHEADLRVEMPEVTRHPDDVLTFEFEGKQRQELNYEHFSVVMSRSRRMCYFSIVNIDGKATRKMARTAWRFDPRIPREAQILKECYGNAPKFSRGHMTRREDPVWGDEEDASRGNSDSMHATNVTPQMQAFNAPVWLGLEDYALGHARKDEMLISVITGPFLLNDDPTLFEVKVPRSFWKVIAFIHDDTGKLCATGYTMSQEEFLSEDEFVFGEYQTTQVSLRAIEKKAGLSFRGLTDHDPLDGIEGVAETPLRDFSDIRFH